MATKREEILHLKTQDDQPYGSSRRCCEMCGVMIWGAPHPSWTDDRNLYSKPFTVQGEIKYIPCNRAQN